MSTAAKKEHRSERQARGGVASLNPHTLAISVVFVAALLAGAAAQEPVGIAGGRVSFVPPEGFKPMSREDILFKFGRRGGAEAPEVVYSNERQSVSVAIRFQGQKLSAGRLPEIKRVLEADLERNLPGLEWVARELVELNGVRWIHFRLKAAAVDTQVVNDIYATVFDGRLLTFNFNSTAALYGSHKDALERSARTITVRQ